MTPPPAAGGAHPALVAVHREVVVDLEALGRDLATGARWSLYSPLESFSRANDALYISSRDGHRGK